MLYIDQHLARSENDYTWHIGEPMPRIVSSVVTFQADSEELIIILDAIRFASKKDGE